MKRTRPPNRKSKPRSRQPDQGLSVATVEWIEQHAEGFERLALIIEAADYMNARRDIDPDAANHVAVSITMLRDELRTLRKRLSP